MTLSRAQRSLLGFVAAFGFFGPNGVFLYYAFAKRPEFIAMHHEPLFLAFFVEAFVVMFLIAGLLAHKPLGKWTWKSFIVLSLLGGIGFSIPAIILLNSDGTNS
jgi:hypothetical protein